MRRFQEVKVCPECEYVHNRMSAGSRFNLTCCPRCGYLAGWNGGLEGTALWPDGSAARVWEGVWWKPWTWRRRWHLSRTWDMDLCKKIRTPAARKAVQP